MTAPFDGSGRGGPALRALPPEPWHRRFQSLMPFRVREILLVSSAYDAFVLEEDGSLTDRLFYEYSELSLSWAPRLTHAPTVARALELASERRFDLVITVVKVADGDAADLSRRVKARHEDMPIVLLIFDEADLAAFPGAAPPPGVDRVFLWTGSASVLIAAIKLTEDSKNVLHDTRAAGVQVIAVVEDHIRSYTSFVALLYAELLTQAGSLIGEGLNDLHRLLRMRARPKIVLATDFHQAASLIHEHGGFLCALMTDLAIPRGGIIAPDGGFELGRVARELDPDLPILVQSAEHDAEARSDELGAWFVDKHAVDFRAQVRSFLKEAVGFGDFVFRLPDRTEVGRARDVYELEQLLRTVPAEAITYHASKNHFSIWLRARSMFALAARIRPQTLEDFADVEALRDSLVAALEHSRLQDQQGVITDLSARQTGPANRFVRIGRGSVGGKGRSVAFLSTEIVRHGLLERFDGLEIRIPKTVVLGTDAFDAFMEGVEQSELAGLGSDDEVIERVQQGHFPEPSERKLRTAFERLRGPLAVRSSSLLEDSRFQPFAGVYATYMLPNVHPDADVRFDALKRAVMAVYASTYWRAARNYLAGTPHDPDDQKMAVVIQQLVGRRFGDRFYPALSGVAQSYNYYPVGAQRSEDGVAHIALGLGHTVVQGGAAIRFSPAAPTVLPQFPTAESFLRGTQTELWALDLSSSNFDPCAGPEASLVHCDLKTAEEDGTLELAGSVYSAADDVIRENLALSGPRVVTFHNVIKWNAIPLAAALSEVLWLLRDAVGGEVEIEIALDAAPLGQRETAGEARTPRLYLLQLRPMTMHHAQGPAHPISDLDEADAVCRTDVALGHGSYPGISDIVYVVADRLDMASSRAFAARVRALNDQLARSNRPYVLIGPGRWGTTDPTLGIGVVWSDIAAARVIIETPIGTRRVEPSQGTHFFRNITAAKVGYLTIEDRDGSRLDRAWLDALWQRAGGGSSAVRHLALDAQLGIFLDGTTGTAIITRPASKGDMAADGKTV